jgi:hypothetical protein
LRLRSILTITVIVLLGIIAIIAHREQLVFSSWDINVLVIYFLILLPIIIHTGILYSISVQSYPDKEISKRLKIVFNIVSVLAWISLSPLLVGLIAILFITFTNEQRLNNLIENPQGLMLLILYFLLVVIIPIQLTLGYKLVSRIRKNYSAFLLKSFE